MANAEIVSRFAAGNPAATGELTANVVNNTSKEKTEDGCRPLSPRMVSTRLECPSVGATVDRQHQRRKDVGGHVPGSGTLSERACFDYLLLEDLIYVGETWRGSREIYLKNGMSIPRQEPSVVATLMVAATSRLGIVPTLSTFAYAPYLVARIIGTLDQVSGGRAGWNMVTGVLICRRRISASTSCHRTTSVTTWRMNSWRYARGSGT